MPAKSHSQSPLDDMSDLNSALSLGSVNTTRFLFDDENERPTHRPTMSITSPDVSNFLQASANDSNFPILRRGHHAGSVSPIEASSWFAILTSSVPQLSTSSAALDLASSRDSKSPTSSITSSGWPSFARHRQAQHSLPVNTLSSPPFEPLSANESPNPTSYHQASRSTSESVTNLRRFDRNSIDFPVGFSSYSSDLGSNGISHSTSANSLMPAPRLSASYSSNDVPTIRNTANGSAQNAHAQQHLHRHNMSLGRIPVGGMNRHSREISSSDIHNSNRDSQLSNFSSPTNGSHFSSPHNSQGSGAVQNNAGLTSPVTMSSGGSGYLASASQSAIPPPQFGLMPGTTNVAFGANNGFSQSTTFFQQQYNQTVQARNRPVQRKMNDFDRELSYPLDDTSILIDTTASRYQNVELSTVRHEIYLMCKDQHGCRFLQKKVEEGNAEDLAVIFEEILPNMVELMTDPFGNYLCQKLLEHCNDAQRTAMIRKASPDILRIAMNQHGTRALQKMIEYLTTKEHIAILIEAMEDKVVPLIQDLNGNHVIQKCLNRLSAEDAQFIFNDVGSHCVVVGTHRHGCCVLQRCIDHASGDQRARLIEQITNNCYSLVTDPFGNYVVQYILDLGETQFTEPIAKRFAMRTCQLSKQKFSSNVVEKCLRVAQPETRRLIISKFMNNSDMEKMLRDSYGNYVVQTAIDFADPDTRKKLIDTIKPILPLIRHTPYGRRITTKINMAEDRPNLPVTLTDAQMNLRRPITRDGPTAPSEPNNTPPRGFGTNGQRSVSNPAPSPQVYAPAPPANGHSQRSYQMGAGGQPQAYMSFAAASRQSAQQNHQPLHQQQQPQQPQQSNVHNVFPPYGQGDQSRPNFF
jgi:hypothetical protein